MKDRPHNCGVNKKTTKTDLILKKLDNFIEQENKRWTKQDKNWAKQEKFNASIVSRLDNIVKLNNIKE